MREVVHTYCALCSSFCPMLCHIANGVLKKVEPDRNHPNGGSLCPKGLAAPELVYNSQRLRYPLKRTRPKGAGDPGWVRISWDEALTVTASKIRRICKESGPEALAFYRGAFGGSPASDYEPWVRRLANALGSPNFITTSYICNWHRDFASRYTFGVSLPDPDLEHTNCIVIWGFNPARTSNTFYQRLKRAVKRGAKLIVIDPRRTEVAREAHVHLAVYPGRDRLVALSMLNTLVQEKLYDRDFVLTWTNAPFLVREDTGSLLRGEDCAALPNGLDNAYVVWDSARNLPVFYDSQSRRYLVKGTGSHEVAAGSVLPSIEGSYEVVLRDGKTVKCIPVWELLKKELILYDPESTESLTRIPGRAIRETVRRLVDNRPVSYYTFNGIEQSVEATQTNRAISILFSLVGDFDQQGGNVVWPALPVNDLRGDELLPKEQRAKRLGVSRFPLGPPNFGHVEAPELYEAILEGYPYKVKGLLAFGGNLSLANPDSRLGKKALQSLEFYFQSELFMTPSAEMADIVVPACTPWESFYVRAGFPRGPLEAKLTVQVRRPVVKPLYESRSDVDIVCGLAAHLGLAEKFFGGSVEAAFDWSLKPLGLTVGELSANSSGFKKVELPVKYRKYAERVGEENGYNGFKTNSGRVEIFSEEFARNGYAPLPTHHSPEWHSDLKPQYPLILTCCKLQNYCHGQHRAVPSLRKMVPHPYLEVNPATADVLGLKEGDEVWLETKYGRIRQVVKLTEDVPRDIVCTQHGWWQSCSDLGLPGYDPYDEQGANVNLLIPAMARDPVSGSVCMKAVPCRLQRVAS